MLQAVETDMSCKWLTALRRSARSSADPSQCAANRFFASSIMALWPALPVRPITRLRSIAVRWPNQSQHSIQNMGIASENDRQLTLFVSGKHFNSSAYEDSVQPTSIFMQLQLLGTGIQIHKVAERRTTAVNGVSYSWFNRWDITAIL